MISYNMDHRKPPTGHMAPGRPLVVVGGTVSDAHTWNLIYLELLLTEHGCRVVNLGCCVPVDVLLESCRRYRPEMVVLSSVNGHGATDAARVGPHLRELPELSGILLVAGGKLTVTGTLDGPTRESLRRAGFDAVFAESQLDAFVELVGTLRRREPSLAVAAGAVGDP